MSKIIEQIKEVDKSLSFVQFKSETEAEHSNQYMEIVHQLLERRSDLMVKRDLEAGLGVSPPKEAQSSSEGNTEPLSLCCKAPMAESESKSVQVMGGLIRNYETKVCSKCRKPSRTLASTKQVEMTKRPKAVEALWRLDGKRFSRNEDGSYSMDNSPHDPKPKYSYARLIESGVFGHEPPPKSS